MRRVDILIDVQDERFIKNGIDEALIVACKDALLSVVLPKVDFLNLNKDFSLNLALSDNQTVQALNKEFRGLDKPTNVLSFANIDDPFFETMLENENDVELGDVIVAFETLSKEADELEISLKDHFCHLWVHGMLHILGYDHIKDNERLEMEAREVEILKKLGIENPYQE